VVDAMIIYFADFLHFSAKIHIGALKKVKLLFLTNFWRKKNLAKMFGENTCTLPGFLQWVARLCTCPADAGRAFRLKGWSVCGLPCKMASFATIL
jgi:hypothetical protein